MEILRLCKPNFGIQNRQKEALPKGLYKAQLNRLLIQSPSPSQRVKETHGRYPKFYRMEITAIN